MKRNELIALIAVLLVAIGSACWGQTADEPWREDAESMLVYTGKVEGWADDPFPRWRSYAPEPLQVLIDGSHGNIVDCEWQTFTAEGITLWTGNTEAILENVIIDLLPNAQIGNFRYIQGRTFNGIVYPAGDVNFTIRNFIIRGGFTQNVGLQAKNEELADAQGWGANAITTITNKGGLLCLENGTIENCGNSAVAGSWDNPQIHNVRFVNVAKHGIGIRENGVTRAEITNTTFTDCGNAIDFHGDGGRLATTDTAVVDTMEVIRPTGRSKCSGNNFEIVGKDWLFRQDSVVNFNMWPAFDLARNPVRFEVDGFTAINFPTMGLGTLSDATKGGTITVNRAYVTNSLSGIKVQQAVAMVSNSIFTGIHHRFRSGGPLAQENNDDQFIGSDQAWGLVYDEINYLYDSRGWARPSVWVPNSLLPFMETR